MSRSEGKRSKSRCAKTVPTSVAPASRFRGRRRVSTATRASSPIRPGSTAFANRPTQKAENTWRKGGSGGGNAWPITVDQAIERATTESRFNAIAAITQRHETSVNALATSPQSGARQTSSASAAAWASRRHLHISGHSRVDLRQPSRDVVPGVLRDRQLPRGAPQLLAAPLVGKQLLDRPGQCTGISGRHEDSG